MSQYMELISRASHVEEEAIFIDAEVSYIKISDVMQGYKNDELFGQIVKPLKGDQPIDANEKL